MDDILTPENFDLLIYTVIIVGLILAAHRLYQDFTRPLPEDDFSPELYTTANPPQNPPEKG